MENIMNKVDACQETFKRLLKTCAIDVSVKGKSKAAPSKTKKKKKLSGYNCFTSNLYAAEKETAKKEKRPPMAYSQLLKMRTWGTLSDKNQATWNDLAKQGCPSIPYPYEVGE